MLTNLSLATLLVATTTIIHIAGISLVTLLIKTHVDHWRYRHPFVRAQKTGEVVLLMFFLSFVDIVVWAGTYLLVGAINTLETALYFSTVTFTTLGYGDVVIDEQWRLLAALEAANGIIIFGLTTAVVVAVVQRVYFIDASN
jgi:voltage-gated potassium channel Kch